MLTTILSFGIIMAFGLVIFITIKWWNLRLTGTDPVSLLVFISILFTSGLDVGLVMFPVAFDFPLYADTETYPTFAFTNPLAIEFGMWGFLIWAFYFLTGFYFCVIEPRVRFFEIPVVKTVNNIVIIATCAFTGSLFLQYLPFYMPMVGDGESIIPLFYVITFLIICAAAYSSTNIKFVKMLSVASSGLFVALILLAWLVSGAGVGGFLGNLSLIGGYFTNIHHFVLPMGDGAGYHAFFLFWWFAWSIMIGQFTSRFVGGLKTQHFLLALLVIPSIPLAIWFSVLYHFYVESIPLGPLMNWAMITVGVIFVVNSFDSLIRLYTDNLNLTTDRLGLLPYLALNVGMLSVLTYAFSSGWLKIDWIGAIVVGIMAAAVLYILARHRRTVAEIDDMPRGQSMPAE
ncbi:Glycine betaine transporter OpuD [Rhodobacteraceae bacterium THAF1]|uniref:BCCT family transporter n=1 Tax=Palleronia sp. THAF1 TaxID=2587842 RepID=UPI000F3C0866|nr:BCCT family transporter [Palleronia sp. THAF1]QFU08019.1 Glycine betaine transporter OpuD [Palleronia sp. THAF1]VDC27872.1 Glycine betaine transporter OpuD [Rhodobacteraceae bacterium THAF1]